MLILSLVSFVFAALYAFGKCVEGNMYWQKRPTWQYHDGSFVGETIVGNRVTYEIRVFFIVVDWKAFRKARMAEKSARDAFVQTIHDTLFLPAFEKRSFLTFVNDEPDRPCVVDYREGEGGVEVNFGYGHGLQYPEVVEHPPISGCKIRSITLRPNTVDPASVEENARRWIR